MRIHFLISRAIVLIAIAGAIPAQAAGLSVSPPHVKFEPGQQTAEVRLTNNGDKPVTVQAAAQRWTQDADGVEKETDAVDFALYPKVFTVAPGKTQVLRVGRLPAAPAQSDSEVAYRLALRELPVDNPGQSGVAITTRMLLPVWLLPKDKRSDWGLSGIGPLEGGVAATVQNRGNVHVRLVDVTYSALGADGAERGKVTAPGWYVLAGAKRRFTAKLPKDFCQGAVRIRAVARTVGETRTEESPAASLCGRGA